MWEEMTGASRLHYVDAHHVQGDGACLDRVDVRAETGQQIGTLDGVIVDVEAGRVRYFVVHSGNGRSPRWEVLPFISARLDRSHRALRVECDRALAAPFSKLDRDAFPKFADDEHKSTLF